jgi:hypothetical protein
MLSLLLLEVISKPNLCRKHSFFKKIFRVILARRRGLAVLSSFGEIAALGS